MNEEIFVSLVIDGAPGAPKNDWYEAGIRKICWLKEWIIMIIESILIYQEHIYILSTLIFWNWNSILYYKMEWKKYLFNWHERL